MVGMKSNTKAHARMRYTKARPQSTIYRTCECAETRFDYGCDRDELGKIIWFFACRNCFARIYQV